MGRIFCRDIAGRIGRRDIKGILTGCCQASGNGIVLASGVKLAIICCSRLPIIIVKSKLYPGQSINCHAVATRRRIRRNTGRSINRNRIFRVGKMINRNRQVSVQRIKDIIVIAVSPTNLSGRIGIDLSPTKRRSLPAHNTTFIYGTSAVLAVLVFNV